MTDHTDNNQPALKPCPLAHPVKNGLNLWSSSAGRKWHICCHDCGLQFEGGYEQPKGDVITLWNSRVSVDGAAPTVDELQRELAFYFGQHHSTLNHREDALRCMVNDCVRVRNLCLTQSHVDTLSAGSGKDAPDA